MILYDTAVCSELPYLRFQMIIGLQLKRIHKFEKTSITVTVRKETT